MKRRALSKRYGRAKDKYGMVPSRFSRDAFGGSERAAHEALTRHEALLVPGVRVRVYRGPQSGMRGVIEGPAGGRSVHVRDYADGLSWVIETRNLELA